MLSIGASSNLIHDFNVVIEDGRNDRNHVGLDNPCPDILRTANTNVDDALEGETPFPHLHQVLAPALLEDAY